MREARGARRDKKEAMNHPSVTVVALLLLAATSLSAREPKPEDTWPGFRGHEMSGVAARAKIPDRWSTTEHVKWAVPIAGHGWSSPIVWGDTVFVTSAISSRAFKKPTPGLYFALDSGLEYQEIARNDLGEMALASPAVAGDALYIRTESKLYKIGR
jgi:hypothetical protein